MDILAVGAAWLHTVAFVIAWGYYGVLGRMVLPALGRSLDRAAAVATLTDIERRALPLILGSVLVFAITGSYLLVVDQEYAGLGAFFDSTWTTLMLAKHLLVIGLVAVGVVVDWRIRGLADAPDEATYLGDLRVIRFGAEGATALGALIALCTVAAQTAP